METTIIAKSTVFPLIEAGPQIRARGLTAFVLISRVPIRSQVLTANMMELMVHGLWSSVSFMTFYVLVRDYGI